MKFSMSKAERRYVVRMALCMAVYIAVLLAIRAWLRSQMPPTGPMLYLAAVVSSLPIVGSVVILGRYLAEETDEYQRAVQVRAVLWATSVTLSVTAVWGFLQSYAHVAAEPAYNTFFFWMAMAVVQVVIRFREKA